MTAGIWMLIFSLFIPVVCSAVTSPDSSDIDTARILTKKGVELERSGKYDQSVSSYTSAIRSYPSYSSAWSGLGSVLTRLGRYQESLSSLDQAVALDPRNAVVWYDRGVVLQQLQRYEQAKSDIDESLKISPNNSHSLARLGEVQLSLGDVEGALKSFQRSVDVNPSDGSAFAGLGEALFRLSDFDKAENATITSLNLYPENVRAWMVMADISHAKGKEDWAAYYKQTAEDIAVSGLTMPEYAKALSVHRIFAYDRALPLYDSAVLKYPDKSVIWAGRGEVLKNLGRYEESLKSYDRAVELSPQNENLMIHRDFVKGLIR
jgi:tetratricopeptide (TPR) repeat protein